MAKHYPQMDIMIEEGKESINPELEIIEELSYESERILKIIKDNKTYYLSGKRNAKAPAKAWVDTLGELQRNAPILIMGTGNPSYLRELVGRTEKSITIIIYEPSLQIFIKFLEMVDLERWMEKHLIVFWVDGLKGMDREPMRILLEQVLKYEMLSFSRRFILPNYDKLFTEKAVDFIKLCREIAVKEVVQFNTKNTFSGVMVKNLFANVKYLCDEYKTTQLIEVIPRDIPGILVAAGPSLNKNIQELKKAKGKAFIIAVDTAIKPLLKAGIVPDMYAIIDAMKPLELVQEEGAREIPLLTTLNAAPEILKFHKGMKFFYNEGYLFAEKIFRQSGQMVGDIACGGSVATSVFSLFHKIGITTIILVGQDLAYTDNKSHADGTFHQIMKEEDTSNFMMVEGNYEEKVPTRTDFKVFIDWYDWYIDACKKRIDNFCVINATEGGAKIKNTEIMSLKEAIQRECKKEINIQQCLKKLRPMLNAEARDWSVNYLHKLPKEYENLKSDAKKLIKLYEKLDKVCNRNNIDSKEYINLLKKIEKLSTAMEQKSEYQLVAITLSNAQYIMGNEQFLSEDTMQKEGKEIARKGILYMKNVNEMADLFREIAESEFTDFV